MAKIKLGAVVTDIRGKIGGQVFSKNRAGAYMKNKGIPANPQTAAQTAVRALFAFISGLWSALTEAQRESFRTKVSEYSRTDVFGDVRNPTGKALHQRLNQNLLNSGQSQIDLCPSPTNVPQAILESVSGADGIQALAAELAGNTTGSKLVFFATDSMSQGTKFVKNKLRQIGVLDGAAAGSFDILAAYTQKFGAVVENDNIYIGVKVINENGQNSPLEVVKATISA